MASAEFDNYYLNNPYKAQFYDRCVNATGLKGFQKDLLVGAIVFLIIVALFTFGPGYNPIAVTFLPALFVILAYGRSVPTPWGIWAVVFPAVSIGTFFAWAGSNVVDQAGPWQTPATVYVLPLALIWGVLISLAVWADRAISEFSGVLLSFVEIFFAFPIIWCGLWTFVYYVSPYGDLGSWGFALAQIGVNDMTVGVIWLFGAISGGAYLTALIVSSTLYIMRRYFEVMHTDNTALLKKDVHYVPPPLNRIRDVQVPFLHPLMLLLYATVVIFGFGSVYRTFSPNSRMFYQTPIQHFTNPTVQVSCLVNGTYASTLNHLNSAGSGSKIVIWSEGSAQITNETEFLNTGLNLAKQQDVMIGVAYYLSVTAEDGKVQRENKFALLIPPQEGGNGEASVAFIQQKIHPIFLKEEDFVAGPSEFKYLDTPYGRIGAAIGTDFDYVDLQKAYFNGVTLMLQPAKSWGPTGPYMAMISQIKSVENGFTTLRCSSSGISGVYDPFYRVLTQSITLGAGDFIVYQVPILKQRWSLYRLFLDYLGIMAMSVFLFWVFFLTFWGLKRWRRRVLKSRQMRLRQQRKQNAAGAPGKDDQYFDAEIGLSQMNSESTLNNGEDLEHQDDEDNKEFNGDADEIVAQTTQEATDIPAIVVSEPEDKAAASN
ncbi:hypothetical protein MP228_000977 [Amoeboaphelidium protococcarum]|nr:hypothetical protein MP228_000977 [Amoeboaphelidium protococcarum]